ncbi:MAG: SUMF1/EgtB/PvdO family nonheme iron enzyme, partial [Verrucomicrobiota bacterium]
MPKKKKFKRAHLRDEKTPLQRAAIVFLVVCVCAGILWCFWFLSSLGPQDVDYRDLKDNFKVTDEMREILEESIELEAQFEEILALREPTEEDIQLLQRSLEVLENYLEVIPGYDSDADKRRTNLKKRYQDFAATSLRIESETLENEAIGLAKAEEYEAARAKFNEAFRAQKKINEDFPLSDSQNAGRATRLQRQARYLTAEPLYQRSLELEVVADKHIESQEWSLAEEILSQSIEIQDQLNREYRGTNQASVARLERLKIKLVGIRSGQSFIEIEAISNFADERRAAGENLEAAELYQEAARLQRQLNEAYRDSPYASSDRVSEFLRKSQTSESYELGLEIERNNDELNRLLSERRTYEATEKIILLRRDIRQMLETFPRSSLNNEDIQVKIRYLNLVQSDLGYIQDRIYDALLPIPNIGERKMLRTEVPQALYSLIMGTNPSRNLGDTKPVDSVSWTEAKEFCERLSWIMGKEIRLPTENEYREALGRLRYVVLEDHVWSASNAEGVAQPVGSREPLSSGYHDLLGNVSEWLESIDRFENEDARHIGGHAQDRLEAI